MATLKSEFKKGSAEMLVLSVREDRDRHGYYICKRIEQESGGELVFNVDLLPTLVQAGRVRIDPGSIA